MGYMFHEKTVARSRFRRVCYWCGEFIDKGDPYVSYRYRDQGTLGRCEMHPECREALGDVAWNDGGWITWSIGDFNRGCGCESGQCECGEQ